ncbi:nuclear transport factor 2 family protein [Phreatobacter stygius]|uniref:Steroid delta-isomerase n=1 Tax=Phreatobacter stygius TaxID=1940610 RepID=A0A4D7B110_9HYPH|nr:nuclear transport factor 2 family protein [Phreatobacter stygius]QCI67314.1 steroid delta-isomerase [Phreatobacter stygius]
MSTATNEPDAETVVARQLDAYNARDIEAFMALWHDDAQVFAHPATLLADGAAAIRARHVARFQEPDLFGRLIARVSVGTMVVDREVVSRNFPEGRGEVDVIAIYEVDGGRIAKAWFKMGAPRMGD